MAGCKNAHIQSSRVPFQAPRPHGPLLADTIPMWDQLLEPTMNKQDSAPLPSSPGFAYGAPAMPANTGVTVTPLPHSCLCSHQPSTDLAPLSPVSKIPLLLLPIQAPISPCRGSPRSLPNPAARVLLTPSVASSHMGIKCKFLTKPGRHSMICSDFISPHSLLCSFLSVPPAIQAHSHLRAFAHTSLLLAKLFSQVCLWLAHSSHLGDAVPAPVCAPRASSSWHATSTEQA
jgi:hypothetical protein